MVVDGTGRGREGEEGRRRWVEGAGGGGSVFIVWCPRVPIANGGWPRHPYPCPRVEHPQAGAGGALTSRLGAALPFRASGGGWVLGCAPLLTRVEDRAGAALGVATWAEARQGRGGRRSEAGRPGWAGGVSRPEGEGEKAGRAWCVGWARAGSWLGWRKRKEWIEEERFGPRE